MSLGAEEIPALKKGVFAPCIDDADLRARVNALRGAGERVICALPGQAGGALEMGCDRILVKDGQGWQVVAVN